MAEFRSRIIGYREVRAADLKGAPWNWRRHPPGQRGAVTASIRELGFFDPLDTRELPDGTLELIDGHLRQDIITADVGPDTLVPCVITDFTEEEARKANLVKDPLAAAAEADGAALVALLTSVQTEDEHLAALLAGLAEAPGPVPALPGGPGDDVADVYQGMPEFVQDGLVGKFKVIVHFEDEAALEDFGRLVGQKMHGHATQTIWHPYKEPSFPRVFIAEDDPGTADES